MDVRDIAVRAAKTFVQAFFGVFVVTDISSAESAAAAGIAAAAAVLINAAQQWASE